ncbi:RNA polymerase subunit sigma [Clostridium sp. DL1XJH146]
MNEYKKVEAMLYNYNSNKVKIKNLELEIESLDNDYRGAGAITYEEKSAPTNKFNSCVENEVVKRDEKLIRLRKLKRLKEIEVEKIDNVISLFRERDQILIEEYYMKRNQLKNISKIINLEESYLSTYKTNIINKIVNILFIEETP